MANGASIWAIEFAQAARESQIALAQASRTGVGAAPLAVIDGAQWLAPIAFPHIGHKVLEVGDAIALAVTLVVQAATAIDAIVGHSMAAKAAIAAVALVDQRVTVRGALDHGVELGHIPFAAIVWRFGLITQRPLHGVAKGIVGARYIHILSIQQILELCLRRIGRYHTYICHMTIQLLGLQIQQNFRLWIAQLLLCWLPVWEDIRWLNNFFCIYQPIPTCVSGPTTSADAAIHPSSRANPAAATPPDWT